MRIHHQNAEIDDLRTTRSPWRLLDLVGITLLLAFVFGLYVVAAAADERDMKKEQAYARAAQRAEQERLAMPTRVAEAYERGLTDAIEALRDTPDGIALAQACMARGGR